MGDRGTLDKFLTNLEYQMEITADIRNHDRGEGHPFYNEPKKVTTKDGKTFDAPETWNYIVKMVNDVPGAPYWSGISRSKTKDLFEGEELYLKARAPLHDQIVNAALKKGDILRVKKEEFGEEGHSKIMVLNEMHEPSRDISESPTKAPEPRREAPRQDDRQKSIIFQTCLKCASWLVAGSNMEGEPAYNVDILAKSLYRKHQKFVNDYAVEEDYSNEPQEVAESLVPAPNGTMQSADDVVREPSNVERIYAMFKLPYPDTTPKADEMLKQINQWLLTYNNEERHQDGFKELDSLKDATGEFVAWLQDMMESCF